MRVMVIVRASRESEAGALPSERTLTAMRTLNEEMTKAGVLKALGGLQPSATGKRLTIAPGRRIITDGPFTETKELIAGYCIMEVGSIEEVLDWLARFPEPEDGTEEHIEIRPLYDEGPCGTGYRDVNVMHEHAHDSKHLQTA